MITTANRPIWKTIAGIAAIAAFAAGGIAIAALAAQQFDTCAFVTTLQAGGLERAARVCDLTR